VKRAPKFRRSLLVGEALADDLVRFDRLGRAAAAVLADPEAGMAELEAAATSAARSTLPRAQRWRGSPLYLLVRTAQAVPNLPDQLRAEGLARLKRHLDAVEGVSVTGADASERAAPAEILPEREPRRDVFG